MGIAIALVILTLLVTGARIVALRRRRDPLRHCPLCSADAVRTLTRVPVSEFLVRLEVRCGACGTWRRMLTTVGSARLLELKLERQTRRMAELADSLERDRVAADVHRLEKVE
jgi:hypothetical protein